ncbi:uncharacterized protein LOC111341479 isoform X1 [Stylophora pistillata]|uniref:Uncharacterized protein n=2 Tax=Stylophora pistillata TaxID=50429 RepID=A0A2B4RL59_STYPI|nr:uncharacterized protein LOC111341479 isoform X1 [Stylophora pistillata]PFX16982.1 hypothetical protein AWC38_SpisGene18720 [Stylophora pistillata]
MKSVYVITFVFLIALCNGAKFPFRQRDRGGADVKEYDEEVNAMMELTMPVPVTDEPEEEPSEGKIPVEEAIIPVTANYLGSESNPESSEGEIVVEETIAPVIMTANPNGAESNPACGFCRGMFGGCYCEDVEWCREIPCEVKQECDEKCPME